MASNNITAVPHRTYGCMEGYSDAILLTMHKEMSEELKVLRTNLRELGAARNGLARVEEEISLRELEVDNGT